MLTVHDKKSGKLYAEYKALADGRAVIFGDRYKDYDTDQCVVAVLERAARKN